MAIKEDYDEDIIFTDINGGALEVYNDDVDTHDFITGVDNNYNNSNNAAYQDGANNKKEVATYEDGASSNATHEDGDSYPPTSATNNVPDNYKQEMVDNNYVDEIPEMGTSEESEILDAIENYITASIIDTTVDMEITGFEVNNTGVHVEITGGVIDTPGMKYTSHEDMNN